jgi:hypothetical protein
MIAIFCCKPRGETHNSKRSWGEFFQSIIDAAFEAFPTGLTIIQTHYRREEKYAGFYSQATKVKQFNHCCYKNQQKIIHIDELRRTRRAATKGAELFLALKIDLSY